MSTPLVLYDDAKARRFEPFALTRPFSEVRAGAALVRHRWEQALGLRATGFVGAGHLEAFGEPGAPPAIRGALDAGTIVASSRFAPVLHPAARADGDVWRDNAGIAAVRLASAVHVGRLASGALTLESLATTADAARGGPSARSVPLDGWWIQDVWDLVGLLPAMLERDVADIARTLDVERDPAVSTLGEHQVFVERGAFVEPYVAADTTAGSILIRSGARVCSFTRLVGPCYVGEHTTIAGGRVAGCSIGEHARVHGEISTSIVVGHANKSHDGFVGHSVIGRWANLGAGTITSNLKNSYGDVSLWTPEGVRRTGLQFLGSLIGDHVKTGIGTRLTTGCVIGAGANVFGSNMPPKFVPPFAWGDAQPLGEYALEKFLEVAERVMKRRGVALDDGTRAMLSAAWHQRHAHGQ